MKVFSIFILAILPWSQVFAEDLENSPDPQQAKITPYLSYSFSDPFFPEILSAGLEIPFSNLPLSFTGELAGLLDLDNSGGRGAFGSVISPFFVFGMRSYLGWIIEPMLGATLAFGIVTVPVMDGGSVFFIPVFSPMSIDGGLRTRLGPFRLLGGLRFVFASQSSIGGVPYLFFQVGLGED